MAFAVKYRLDVQAMDGQTDCRVDILEDGWAGAITDLQPSAVPIVYRKGERNEDKAKIIVPTTLEITVKAESDFQFIALTEIEEQELKVQYYEDSILQFEGWVLPDEYTEAYIDPPYDVRIVATDYLAQLKNVSFRNASNNRYPSRESILYFIKEALLKTGLALNIKENVNIYDTAMTTAAADSPLVQGTIDPIIFYPDDKALDTYTALEYLIKIFRCRVYQENATWYIEQINEKQAATFIERTYDSAGVYTGQTTITPLVKLTRPDASPTRRIMRAGAIIDNDRPFKDVSAYYRLNDKVGTTILRGFTFADDWVSTSQLEDWTVTGTTVTQRPFNDRNDQFTARIDGEAANLASAGYLESDPIALTATASTQITLRWLAQVNATSITTKTGAGYLSVRLEATSSANVYYFYGNSWITADVPVQYRSGRKFNRMQGYEYTIPAVPEDGNLFIRFYQVVEQGGGIGSVQSLELANFFIDLQTEEIQTTAWLVNRGFVNEKVSFTTEKEIILFADGPAPTSSTAIKVGATNTSAWARRGVTESSSILRLFLQLTANLYQKNAFRLSADLSLREGRTLKFQNTFADQDSVSTRKYYFGFYEWRPAEGVLSVEGIQFIAGDASLTFETFNSEDLERTRWDGAGTNQPPATDPIFDPDVLTPAPPIIQGIPALGGDIINAFDSNEASPQLIKGKLDAGYSGITSSNVVINTTREDVADEPLRKITAKDFIINAYASKATPVAADRLVISDSEDSDELKTIEIGDLPIDGSKWTEVANGIYRNGRVAIGKNTVDTGVNLQVEGKTTFRDTSSDIIKCTRITNLSSLVGFASFNLDLEKSGGVLNGQGAALQFITDGSTSSGRCAAIVGIKRGTQRGELQVYVFDGGGARTAAVFGRNRSLYVGDRGTSDAEVTTEADAIEAKGRIKTGNPAGSTARYWKFGEREPGTVTPDGRATVEINGVLYWIAVEEAVI